MSRKIFITAALTLALFLGTTSATQLKSRSLNQLLAHNKSRAQTAVKQFYRVCESYELNNDDENEIWGLAERAYKLRYASYTTVPAYAGSYFYYSHYKNLVKENFASSDAFQQWLADEKLNLESRESGAVDAVNQRIDNIVNGYDVTSPWNLDNINKKYPDYAQDSTEEFILTKNEAQSVFWFYNDLLTKNDNLNVQQLFDNAMEELKNVQSLEEFNKIFAEITARDSQNAEFNLDYARQSIRNTYSQGANECQDVRAALALESFSWIAENIAIFIEDLQKQGCADLYGFSEWQIDQELNEIIDKSANIWDFYYSDYQNYRTSKQSQCDDAQNGYNSSRNENDALYNECSYDAQYRIDNVVSNLVAYDYWATEDSIKTELFYVVDCYSYDVLSEIEEYYNDRLDVMKQNNTSPYCDYYVNDCQKNDQYYNYDGYYNYNNSHYDYYDYSNNNTYYDQYYNHGYDEFSYCSYEVNTEINRIIDDIYYLDEIVSYDQVKQEIQNFVGGCYQNPDIITIKLDLYVTYRYIDMKANKTQPFCNLKQVCDEPDTVLDQLDETFWKDVEYFVQNLTQLNVTGEVDALDIYWAIKTLTYEVSTVNEFFDKLTVLAQQETERVLKAYKQYLMDVYGYTQADINEMFGDHQEESDAQVTSNVQVSVKNMLKKVGSIN